MLKSYYKLEVFFSEPQQSRTSLSSYNYSQKNSCDAQKSAKIE